MHQFSFKYLVGIQILPEIVQMCGVSIGEAVRRISVVGVSREEE